jgi:hypothetical protein
MDGIGDESHNFTQGEHVEIEKAGQLFRNMLRGAIRLGLEYMPGTMRGIPFARAS